MKKRLLIAGCGYVGLALSRFMSQQASVWGLRRSIDAVKSITDTGAQAITADMSQDMGKLPNVNWVVCAQAPNPADDDRITYVDATANLISALKKNPPEKFVWISSTSVYGQTDGQWVDENTDPNPKTTRGKILLEAEGIARSAPFPSIVVRLGGIYGQGRDPRRRLFEGNVSLQGFLNHLHVDDAVGIIACVLDRGIPGQIYLGVDDEPVLRSEYYEWVAKQTGIDIPDSSLNKSSRFVGNKRCSNRSLKDLGYAFKYKTYREGFMCLLEAQRLKST